MLPAKSGQSGDAWVVLGKEQSGPSKPMRTCKEREETSTPQMILITVTCLLRAIEISGDCSVVRASGGNPKAPLRLLPEGDGRRPPREGFEAFESLAATFSITVAA
jgi:hypothetical protein